MLERFAKQVRSKSNPESMEIRSAFGALLDACRKRGEAVNAVGIALRAPTQLVKTLYERAPKKYKEILGVLIFASTFQSAQIASANAEEAAYQNISYEEGSDAKVSALSGFDITALAARTHRTAEFQVTEQTAHNVIIHLGQMHSLFDAQANFNLRNKISKSQGEIADILTETSRGDQAVFIEAYSKEFESDARFVENVYSFLKDARTVAELREKYNNAFKEIYEKHKLTSMRLIGTLNKLAADKLHGMGLKEVSPLVFSNGKDNLALYEPGYIPREQWYTVSNEVESRMAGAAWALDAKGRIHIEPAETSEGNEKMQQLEEKLQLKGKALGKLFSTFDGNPSSYRHITDDVLPNISKYSADEIETIARNEPCRKNRECQAMAKEIVEADIPALQKAIVDDREDIAMGLIGVYAAHHTGQHVFPLVYGDSHDYTRAVIKWNAAHPEERFDLVKLSSKTD